MVTKAKSNQTKINQVMMNSQTTMGSQATTSSQMMVKSQMGAQMMESYQTTMMTSHTMMKFQMAAINHTTVKFQMMLSSYQMMGITKKTSPSGGMRMSTTISKTITIIGKMISAMMTSNLILMEVPKTDSSKMTHQLLMTSQKLVALRKEMNLSISVTKNALVTCMTNSAN